MRIQGKGSNSQAEPTKPATASDLSVVVALEAPEAGQDVTVFYFTFPQVAEVGELVVIRDHLGQLSRAKVKSIEGTLVTMEPCSQPWREFQGSQVVENIPKAVRVAEVQAVVEQTYQEMASLKEDYRCQTPLLEAIPYMSEASQDFVRSSLDAWERLEPEERNLPSSF